MSHAGLGLREEPLYKGTLGAWDLGHKLSPLHTRRLKSQHHENSSSTSTTTALSVSCTLPLPPYFPYHVLGPWRPCFWGSFGSITPSFRLRFAASLSVRTVGNTLSPMLQTAGTTVHSRKKFQQAMVDFSVLFTPIRGCLVRHTHGYREFPRLLGLPLLSPFRSRPIAQLQLESIHSAGTLLPSPP